jgi:hypothetical protein
MTWFRMAVLAAFATLLPTICAWTTEKKDNKLPSDARAILEKAEQLELLSLDPAVEGVKAAEGFHGWKILGKTVVKDASTRKQILTALDKGIAESDGNGAKCFDPRNGIRAKRGNKTVDLVICFECGWIYVFHGDKEDRQGVAVTTGTPQAVLDKVLKEAKVPLPKPAKK